MISKYIECIVNTKGRIIDSSVHFNYMFGFSKNESLWHYIFDLMRYPNTWPAIADSICTHINQSTKRKCIMRKRTRLLTVDRKGRSFSCTLILNKDEDMNIISMRLSNINKVVNPKT